MVKTLTRVSDIGTRIVELRELAYARWRAANSKWWEAEPDISATLTPDELREYRELLTMFAQKLTDNKRK